MSTFKRLLALTLALAMVLSVSAFAGNYTDSTYADADKINEDCEDAVELMYALDIMVGDGTNFNPESTVTRAEMAKMIYVVLNYGKDDKAVTYTGARMFTDVPVGAWYEGYVNYAAATKLVQGRGNGTFGPMDPVSAAEAAKMLLTAIGYSAELRGYTGANWDKNVLSDASIIGLLNGYKANTNTYAPRQWVAVMMSNALLDALTYTTMTPNFSGLLTSGENTANVTTMGGKYYDLRDFTGYLYATDTAYIDQVEYTDDKTTKKTDYADDDCAIFTTGKKDKLIQVENPGVGYLDLGKQYRVIHNSDGDVYSAKETGVSQVGEAIQYEVGSEIIRNTSSNEASNKYQFTFGDLTATFEENTINCLVASKRGATAKVAPTTITAKAMSDKTGLKYADLFRAVDKDGDNKIDYIIVKDYSYAQITKVAEHKAYGEYFTASDVSGNPFKAEGFKAINSTGATTQWYLEDVVNTENELAKGNVIKVVYNPDNGKYDVEALPVEDSVVYEKRTTKGVHTLGGQEYVIAADGFEPQQDVLVASNLKDELSLVADGELVILAKPVDSDVDSLDEINAQLVMVTDAYVDIFDNSNYNRYYIDYMTIDGEKHEEVRYVDGKHGTLADGSYDTADSDVNYDELAGYLANHQRLFVLVESGSGVYLKKLTSANAESILDYADSLLSGYLEDSGTLDTEDNKFGSDFVENENLFFVSYTKPGKTTMYFDVLTLDDLGEGTADGSFIQGLYNTKRTVDTHLAGHIYIDGLNLVDAKGYLYTTDQLDVAATEWNDGNYDYEVTGVVFADGYETEDGYILVDTASDALKPNALYAYSYERSKDAQRIFTLTLIDELGGTSATAEALAAFDLDGAHDTGFSEIVDNGSSKLVVKDGSGNLIDIKVDDDTVIALKTVLYNTNIADTTDHDDPDVIDEVTIDFVTFEDLVAETDGEYDNFIAGGSTVDYVYLSDFYAEGSSAWGEADKILYVVVYGFMNDANNG